jgi:hypothetical protein
MFELKALRQSVKATHEEMANEMGISLHEYRDLESSSERLDDRRLRRATFAALRIAIAKDGGLPKTELFEALDDVIQGFSATSRISRGIH